MHTMTYQFGTEPVELAQKMLAHLANTLPCHWQSKWNPLVQQRLTNWLRRINNRHNLDNFGFSPVFWGFKWQNSYDSEVVFEALWLCDGADNSNVEPLTLRLPY